jgi:hypothetical protein
MEEQKQNEEASQEFQERKTLIELQRETDLIKHKFHMEELKFERESALIIHEQILERGRIKWAEERKMQARGVYH